MRKTFIAANQMDLLETITNWNKGEGYEYFIININFEPYNPETKEIKAYVDYRIA